MGPAMAEVAVGEPEGALAPVHVFGEEPGQGVLKMFRIGDLLGEGSFGQVHRAVHIKTGDEVALKSIPKSDDEPGLRVKFGDDLLRRALEELKHENIIRYFAFGEDLQCSYVAMELLTGPDLSDYFGDRAPLPGPEAAEVMSQATAAIAFLHENKVLHRDIKPENFMFATPALETLKLIDFGSLVSGTRHSEAEAAGSVGFCAPECIMHGVSREESDVFSLGVVLCIGLTGAWPAPMRPELWQEKAESGDPTTIESYREGLKGLDEPGALRRWLARTLPQQETLAALLVKMLAPDPDCRAKAAQVRFALTLCEIADATFSS